MSICNFCGNPLNEAQYLLVNNEVYKSCPECSKHKGEHIHYFCPELFGVTPQRVTGNNPMGLQSHCSKCRSTRIGPHDGAFECSMVKERGGFIISEVRFLPMSKSIFATYEDVKNFIENTFVNREGIYYFKSNQMNCPPNSFVLFQYDGELIGYAVYLDTIFFDEPLIRSDGIYSGYYQFDCDSITLLNKPITKDDVAKIEPQFNGFGQGAQKKTVGFLPAIFEIINGKGIINVRNNNSNSKIPEEIEEKEHNKLFEGAKKQIIVNAYERNQQARMSCINYYRKKNNGQLKCEICGFSFGDFYGENFAEKIHVHHIIEISSVGKEYEIDAIKDLIPICPNCHMIIHTKKPAYLPSEIRKMIKKV